MESGNCLQGCSLSKVVYFVRFLYTILFYAVVPFILFRLVLRSRKAPAYRQRLQERFALYNASYQKGVIWFHAVSVGEAEAVFPLVVSILDRYPGTPVLITTTTPTGSARVKSVLGDRVEHVYLPYDLPGCIQRFLGTFQPRLAVIVETEIWPNLYRLCGDYGISLAIINARLSQRSAKGYSKLKSLTSATLSNVSLIAAQTEEDAARFESLGALPEKIVVTGNIKFDYEVPSSILDKGKQIRQNLYRRDWVWIAASTHDGEDEQVLAAYDEIRSREPQILLVLVARHPERFKAVEVLCRSRGLNVTLRSTNEPCSPLTDVFLVDTLGELKLFYATADIAFVGGSLVKTGGHNILEPAAVGLPVIFGPHMFNFQSIAELFTTANAAVQIDDSHALAAEVLKCLQNPPYRDALGQRALMVVNNNKGAIDKVMEQLEGLITELSGSVECD